MKMIIEKELCYGCGACAKRCPQNCIEMQEDEKGFLYPAIDQKKCIDCGLCQKVCIRNTPNGSNDEEVNCYIGVHRNENIWMSSSSGGAFTAIIQELEEKAPIIFGACYDKEMRVKHTYCMDVSQTSRMRKSKYVQSAIDNAYSDAENFLKEGRTVIFTGTPCQIAGLYAAIGEHENLYTIDLVCTGVVSPKIWRKYISYLEDNYHKKIKNVDMRYKVKNKESWNIGDTEVTFTDGTSIRNSQTRLYRKMYGQKMAYRESCYKCQFATSLRKADITIGDWWGSIDELEGVWEHKGISLIIGNTAKGNLVVNELEKNMILQKIELQEAISDNPTLSHATGYTKRSEKFWEDFMEMNAKKFLRKYARPETKIYVMWLLSRLIPETLRVKIKGVIRK